jgi:hypothetical protein
MDFAFAPGKTEFDTILARLYANRAGTTLIAGRKITTVSDFIKNLQGSAAVTKPTGDLFIVSHGNESAWMKIQLDAHSGKSTTYEAAEKAKTSGWVDLGTLAPPSVNFRGCRIGRAAPFVDKLKEAFGGGSSVTAPLHFDYAVTYGGIGNWETLMIGFELPPLATPIATRTLVIDAFKAEAFTFHDGTTLVPDSVWEKWVARKVNRLGHQKVSNAYVDLGRTIGTLKKLKGEVEFRHDTPTFTFTISGLSSFPAKADQKDTLRTALNAKAAEAGSVWDPAHPLPMYKRYRLANIDDFVDGFTWGFSWDKSKKTMVCSGKQHVYAVAVPITDPPDIKTGKLIYNYVPIPAAAGTQVDELLTSDVTLFYTA